MSKAKNKSASNWKVQIIRDSEAGRRGTRWEKVAFIFTAHKGLKDEIQKIGLIIRYQGGF